MRSVLRVISLLIVYGFSQDALAQCNPTWQKILFFDPDLTAANTLFALPGGDYAITGRLGSPRQQFIARIDACGKMKWLKILRRISILRAAFDNSSSAIVFAGRVEVDRPMQTDSNGNLVPAYPPTWYSAYIGAMSPSGDMMWEKNIGQVSKTPYDCDGSEFSALAIGPINGTISNNIIAAAGRADCVLKNIGDRVHPERVEFANVLMEISDATRFTTFADPMDDFGRTQSYYCRNRYNISDIDISESGIVMAGTSTSGSDRVHILIQGLPLKSSQASTSGRLIRLGWEFRPARGLTIPTTANSLVRTSDGYVVSGSIRNTADKKPATGFLLKITKDGKQALRADGKAWETQLPVIVTTVPVAPPGFAVGLLNKVIQTSSGDFVACGEARATTLANEIDNILLVRFTHDGTLQWAKRFDSSMQEICTGLVETSDNGLLVMGNRGDYSSTKLLLIKTDNSGNYAR